MALVERRAVVEVVVHRREVEAGDAVAGVELNAQLMRVVARGPEGVDVAVAERAPALGAQPVVVRLHRAEGGQAVVGGYPGDLAEVVRHVAHAALPVQSGDVAVPVGFEVAPDLFRRRRAVQRVDAVRVVVDEEVLGVAPGLVCRPRLRLVRGELYQLDVRDLCGGGVEGAGMVAGGHPPGDLAEGQLLVCQVGDLPEDLDDALALCSRHRRQREDGEGGVVRRLGEELGVVPPQVLRRLWGLPGSRTRRWRRRGGPRRAAGT